MPGPKRLRELVRDIRAARTAVAERHIVNRECALIRDSFREENNAYRCLSLAKLLYIHMLGYPAHFGQLECLKLIASPRFTDKRVGYLGAMLLLDEQTELHLLVTNSLKSDLNHTTVYINSLALCTLGSICSAEMSRDLAGEVERLIKSSNPYLKKKALLCAFQIIRKAPDLMEMFVPCTRSLKNDKRHGVLLASICLIHEMCERSPDILEYFRKQLIQPLVWNLKNLTTAGCNPDYIVNNIPDPFLQVKILRLMRVLGHGCRAASESMNDILAQVATSTRDSTTVGHAILYEIVLTIMGIDSDSALRVVAVNILGRFLVNTDKDIRYVALNTLLKVVHQDTIAVQRYRSTILKCLRDKDTSIARRALALCFALINRENVEYMVKEMLLYLQDCNDEFKGDICSKIVSIAESYAHNKRWHIDTVLSVLTTAGNYARDDVVSSLVVLIARTTELHTCITKRLFSAIREDFSQQPLVQVASWAIGEYGDLLVDDGNSSGERDVIAVLRQAMASRETTMQTRQMLLNTLIKLTTRFSSESFNELKELISVYSTNTNLEVQQRSVEYQQICQQPNSLRAGLLDYMPTPATTAAMASQNDEDILLDTSEGQSEQQQQFQFRQSYAFDNGRDTNGTAVDNQSEVNFLDLLTGPTNEVDAQPTINATVAGTERTDTASTTAANLFELLGGFTPAPPTGNGGGKLSHDQQQPSWANPTPAMKGVAGNKPNGQTNAPAYSPFDGLASELADLGLTSHSTAPSPMTVYDAYGVCLVFNFDPPVVTAQAGERNRVAVHIHLVASTTGPTPVEHFEFQAAVPTSCQLQLLPPSSTSIRPGLPVTQSIKLTAPVKIAPKMRVKLQYQRDGQLKVEQFQIDHFPTEIWKR